MGIPLRKRLNERDGVSTHKPNEFLLNILKLRVTGLCEGNSPVTCEFPAQKASNTESASIWWRHHAYRPCDMFYTVEKCFWTVQCHVSWRPQF